MSYLYANLSDNRKGFIFQEFDRYRELGSDPLHATMCAANSVFRLTVRELNGKRGSECFAAALAVLVMDGRIAVSFKPEEG